MRYDSEAAWRVEDALRLMWKRGYRSEREVLIWYFPEKVPVMEIAKILGVSERTAYRRKDVAINTLGLHCTELNQK